ncbi:1,4-alpha-glucan branching enzyme [Streptomyces lomondensis]|uniref:1,4-alpha-glucan branching enzyme GlgB n=1 Tax=Streptomyces lomondensis TaxID=68229 RepID=A0ABQ2XUZ4_9ACTN|nr:1,4-alpha-glucan branching enzyme [Streptomyces lomondensis]MCF0082856.1 1,4-alpha-glucan branching enzyme [Streptomyces lomondensis]GGX34821.1 1,4-alpha-glucan branching enzyme GlgB 1 [Streptomyces lomondensis]
MTPRPESSGSRPQGTAGEKIPEQPTAAQQKSAAKKTAVPKQAAAKKTAPAKKAAARKTPSGQSPATKSTAKKATPAKTTAKKAAAKKASAKKTAPEKAVAEKAAPEKAAVAKKTAAKKAVAKKAAATKATTAKSTTAKSTTAKSTAAKSTTAKAAAKKTTVKKTTAKKATATKAPAQKAAATKAPTKKAPAKKAPARKAAAAQAVPPEMEVAISPAVDAVDRERLLEGTHHAPHSVLGAHPVPGGIAFRAFRPYALSVTVVAGELRAELHADGEGFFSGLLPLTEVPAYRLLVEYEGTVLDTEDAYRFLPTLGDLDLHLIGEGRHEELWTALGAHPMTHQGVTGTRFAVWAPNARGVRVAGTFNFWDGTGHAMRSLGSSGVWELFLPDVGEGELYKFEITRPDGSKTMRADPLARRTEVPPATSSVITSSDYEWGDAEWLARRAEAPAHEAPFSVYEIHLPSWRPGLTYRQLAEQLPGYVKNLGFTHVELMPVAEHPFGGSWGYQVTGFYAPTARLGTPDDFRYLVDKLHQAGIGVLMDWVPAHFPRDDWALAEFDGRPLYEHADPLRAAHPDWGTLEFDYGRNEVRNFLVANAVYWCEEFHIDGLRVDAVASMLYLDYSREPGQWTPNEHGGRENLDAVAFLQEMNATVYRRVPGVVTIAEESTAWDGVTRATHHKGPSGFGGLGFGLKWNMGWMHDSLQYMSHEPVHRKYHHHEMTFSMVYAYSENYVLPISHDEVVHGKGSLVSKMPGDWWQQRANHRAYLGFMWAHPGKQLLFMGQEFAQGAEWSEAHGPDWWLLDPGYGAEADHRGVRDLVRDLNTVYRATPALWRLDTDPAGFEWIVGDAADDNVLAFLRLDPDGNPVLAVSNFAPVVRPDYRLGVPEDVPAWHEAVNTDAARYGGSDVTHPDPVKPEAQPWHGRPASIRLTLPPLATVWLRPA